MKTLCRLAACIVALATLTVSAMSQTVPAVSAPVTYENLAVYFVRGNGSGGAAPLTLDQAVTSGQAKVRWRDGNPITVENLSDLGVFVPFGTLLKGGLQDQVTSASLFLPPHSGPIPLATFCVDPFRSTARDQEDPNTLAVTGQMFPGHLAKLAMLVSAPDSNVVRRLRQSAVWWNIDTTRSDISRNLGVAIEPPHDYHWATTDLQDQIFNVVLGARTQPWTTSLPLALENTSLIGARQSYVDALAAAADSNDIVGAVFAINGNVAGAEVYQSHTLFAAMWPKLLRANAVEALAANRDLAQDLPTVETVDGFLASALAGAERARVSGRRAVLRDSEAAVVAETRATDGSWINRSFVARAVPAAAAATPEAALLGILTTARVNERPLESLGWSDMVVLRRDGAGDGWSTAIQDSDPWSQFDLGSQLQALLSAGLGTPNSGSDGKLASGAITLAFFTLLFWMLVPLRRAKRRSRVIHTRFGAGYIGVRTDSLRGDRFEPAWQPDCQTDRRLQPVPTPARPRLASTALALKAFVVMVAVALKRVSDAVRRWRGAMAGFPSAGIVAAVARYLGPAWPGNFRPPARAMRMASRT